MDLPSLAKSLDHQIFWLTVTFLRINGSGYFQLLGVWITILLESEESDKVIIFNSVEVEDSFEDYLIIVVDPLHHPLEEHESRLQQNLFYETANLNWRLLWSEFLNYPWPFAVLVNRSGYICCCLSCLF